MNEEIMDETEITVSIVCNQRSYLVPKDVFDEIIMLREYKKTDEEAKKFAENYFKNGYRMKTVRDQLKKDGKKTYVIRL